MKRWIRFVNRKDWQPSSSSYISIKHFEEKYDKQVKNCKRYRLAMNRNLLRLYSIRKKVSNKNSEINNVTSPIFIFRRTTRKRLYQKD